MKLLRRLMIVALMICFILPMSQCTVKHPDETESTTVFYPYEISIEIINEVADKKTESLGMLLALAIVYFIPILLELLTPIKRSIITITTAIYAEYFLYSTIFEVDPRFGGVLSMALWLGLFITALIELIKNQPTAETQK